MQLITKIILIFFITKIKIFMHIIKQLIIISHFIKHHKILLYLNRVLFSNSTN